MKSLFRMALTILVLTPFAVHAHSGSGFDHGYFHVGGLHLSPVLLVVGVLALVFARRVRRPVLLRALGLFLCAAGVLLWSA